MAYRYQSLGALNFVTQTWFMPNAAVGPHRRMGERPDPESLVEVGGAVTKKAKGRKYESLEDLRVCARRKQRNTEQGKNKNKIGPNKSATKTMNES